MAAITCGAKLSFAWVKLEDNGCAEAIVDRMLRFSQWMPRHSCFVWTWRPKITPACRGFQKECRSFHCSGTLEIQSFCSHAAASRTHAAVSTSRKFFWTWMPWFPFSCPGIHLAYYHMKCLNAAVSNSYAATSSWRIISIFFLTSDLQLTNLPCNLIKLYLKIHEMKKTNKNWKILNT